MDMYAERRVVAILAEDREESQSESHKILYRLVS